MRYTQQVVAAELAGWQDLHEKMGRKAVRDLVRGMLVKERVALEGMRRAVRKLRLEHVATFRSSVPDAGLVEAEGSGGLMAGNEGVVEEAVV